MFKIKYLCVVAGCADYSRVMILRDSLDVVIRTADPRTALTAVFGAPYSNKRQWPDSAAHVP